MCNACDAYARADVSATMGLLDDLVKTGGKTCWEREGLFLRAKIKEKDLGDIGGALGDLRRLTVTHPGTPAAAIAQFRIARLYEDGGLLDDAYREYVLCSRLRGFAAGRGATPQVQGDIPGERLTPEAAEILVSRAAVRAVTLFGRLPADTQAGAILPASTFILADPSRPIEIPPDRAAPESSALESSDWYVVAPPGKLITRATVEFAGAIDRAAAGRGQEKHYGMTLEPLAAAGRGPALALSGVDAEPRVILREVALGEGVPALKITAFRAGARVQRLNLRGELAAGTPSADTPQPALPGGLRLAVPPRASGAGGVCLARTAQGQFIMAYHSPGPSAPAEPDEDMDLYLTTSADGRAWTEPVRLPVSSAVEDREPSIAVLADGRLLLAWVSDRRGAGASDVYCAESRDAVKWSSPWRLDTSALGIVPADASARGPRGANACATLHNPALATDARGGTRLFFLALGFNRTARRAEYALSATGLYASITNDGRRWNAPAAIVSTPATHLSRFKPAPKVPGPEEEAISHAARPSVVELAPDEVVVAWTSTLGRVFLSRRTGPGEYATEDSGLVSGGDEAASAALLLGPLKREGFGILALTHEKGPRVFRKGTRGWSSEAAFPIPPGIEPGACAVGRAPAGPGWIVAFGAAKAEGPAGIYVADITLPEKER